VRHGLQIRASVGAAARPTFDKTTPTNKMKSKLVLVIAVFCCVQLKAQSNESLYIKYSFMNNHIIEISDSGFAASRSFYVHRRFWNKLKRKKLFIPKDELDSLAFYRLVLFLRLNQCLANVKNVKEESLGTPEFFYLHCPGTSDTTLITDNSRNVIPGLAYSQYMLNELRMLINDFIPEKHGYLRISIINKPSVKEITEGK